VIKNSVAYRRKIQEKIAMLAIYREIAIFTTRTALFQIEYISRYQKHEVIAVLQRSQWQYRGECFLRIMLEYRRNEVTALSKRRKTQLCPFAFYIPLAKVGKITIGWYFLATKRDSFCVSVFPCLRAKLPLQILLRNI